MNACKRMAGISSCKILGIPLDRSYSGLSGNQIIQLNGIARGLEYVKRCNRDQLTLAECLFNYLRG